MEGDDVTTRWKRITGWLIGVALVATLAGGVQAQDSVKIGLLATLEGPFAAGGQDGMRGAELAVKQRNGMVAGKKIEILKASSDAKPDVAVNATRKLVEQDKVQIMVGPLSGSEGIAVKDYSKTQPGITFINGSSGAQATTLQNPSPNFFRFNTEGAQWMVGLGRYAFETKGYKKMMVIAEDYAFPYSQVQGFMTEYCKVGGKVPTKAWVPLGTKDYSSTIATIPKDIDALLVVLGGADAVNFLTQYEQAGGNKPMVGGSITVDQTVLNFRGKRRESLLGTISAGPIEDSYGFRQLCLIIGGIDPNLLQVCASKTCQLEAHERNMIDEKEVACQEPGQRDQSRYGLLLKHNADLYADAMRLQRENAANGFVKCPVGLHHMIMDMSEIGVDRDAHHEVVMPNGTKIARECSRSECATIG